MDEIRVEKTFVMTKGPLTIRIDHAKTDKVTLITEPMLGATLDVDDWMQLRSYLDELFADELDQKEE